MSVDGVEARPRAGAGVVVVVAKEDLNPRLVDVVAEVVPNPVNPANLLLAVGADAVASVGLVEEVMVKLGNEPEPKVNA